MTLHIRYAAASQAAWEDFAKNAVNRPSWFTHRIHRDLLLEHAAKVGLPGWLNPPFAFFSELPKRFGVKAKAISLLDRRSLVNALANENAKAHGIRLPAAGANITRSSVIDTYLSEVLPDGIQSSRLSELLEAAATDDFARRRNAWVVSTYSAYLDQLNRRGLYDPRQVHALIAERIENGELENAIKGDSLHIFGLYSTHARRRLLGALADQQEVEVSIYTTTSAVDDFRELGAEAHETQAARMPARVQPVPDAWREAEWIATEVKKLIAEAKAEPHEIAVVARTGQHDVRRVFQVMTNAGIPSTARVRVAMPEIGAIKALLIMFRAAAENWSYPNLRRVLTSPYFRTEVDIRTIDRIAQSARPHTLQAWVDELDKLIARLEIEATAQTDPERQAAIRKKVQRYQETRQPLLDVFGILDRLNGARAQNGWIELTREILLDGWFDFRRRVCRPPLERNDVVRFDQRGVRQLEGLLQQWSVVADSGEMTPSQWYALIRSLLSGQELALTTPSQKGVQILEAHDAALVPFRATFLLHANDGVFPKLPRAGGLFAEEEKAALFDVGLPLETYETALRREKALWQAVTAGNNVTITYRTTDPKGTPLLPSLLMPSDGAEDELPRSTDLVGEPLNVMQESYEDACSLGEVIRSGSPPTRILAADPAFMRRVILQAYAEQMRGAPTRISVPQPLNQWNGVISDPNVLAWIADRYGPNHVWSASQLETYGDNPFFFLIKRVLRIEEIEEADEETTALTSGGVAHGILERFYGEMKGRLPTDKATATKVFIAAARDVFAEREASGEWLGLGLFWQQRKHALLETLVKFIDWEFEKNDPRPEWCEYVLGGSEGITTLHGDDRMGNRVAMRLSGRIDRVDRLGDSCQVIDYKSNSTPSGMTGYQDGAVLQGMIYMEALQQAGVNATTSLYRSIKKRSNTRPLGYEDDAYIMARKIAFSIPDRVRRGLFEANLAASSDWADWSPDLSIVRNRAQLAKGKTRFDAVD